MTKINRFAFKPAKWVYDIEDKDVWSSVMALLFEHQYTGEPFAEESFKKRDC